MVGAIRITAGSNGAFIVWQETAKKRMVAKLRAVKAELRRRMYEPVASV
jgi:predicted DCC family thiol-disulfide oxidoreductase YuxK